MRILVSGVAGFLGSNLLDRLLADGHSVIGIDDLSTGRKENIAHHSGHPQFAFIEGDICNKNALAAVRGSVDRVVHLAARKIPRYGNRLATLTVNLDGTRTVLEYARSSGIKTVLASTSDVYGRNPEVPFSEERSDLVLGSPKSARWAYAVSKAFDEHLGFAYQEEYGLPVTLLRFFGSYGPRHHLSWWGGPQPVFIDAILKGEPVTIHGDGKQTRTFTYVDDTIEGICRSVMLDEANGEVFNIGGTEEVSILELATVIWELCATGKPLEIEFVPYQSFTGQRYDDVRRRVPDVEFAHQKLGFVATTPLLEGLKRTIAWQRDQTP